MSKRMPQIQKLPFGYIVFIFCDNIPLHFDTGFNYIFPVFPGETGGSFFKKLPVSKYTVFQGFRYAVCKNFWRKGFKRVCVTKHKMRLIKCPCQIFSCFQVDCRFPADGGIYCCQKCCGEQYKTNPSLVDCCRKACNIPDYAAADAEARRLASEFLHS